LTPDLDLESEKPTFPDSSDTDPDRFAVRPFGSAAAPFT
jgi:hypothetical protein